MEWAISLMRCWRLVSLCNILGGGFKIDMCFEYRDDNGGITLQWYQEKINSIVKDKSTKEITFIGFDVA